MAKSSFLIRQLFQSGASRTRAAQAARGQVNPAQNTPDKEMKKSKNPQISSLVLVLILVMLAGVFLVQSLV